MYLGPSHTAHRQPNEGLTVGLKKKRVHPYTHVFHFSFLSCFNAVLMPPSLCFWVILILERWVSFSFLNSTVRSDVPSSLALKPKACLYLCHLTSVGTCCRSAEIFSWKPYLAKYRLPFVRAFLRQCLLHALFYALSAPTPPPPPHNFLIILVLGQKMNTFSLLVLAWAIEQEPGLSQILPFAGKRNPTGLWQL